MHPLGGAPYRDLDTVINEQGSGRRILSDALHRRPGVVQNKQGSPPFLGYWLLVKKKYGPYTSQWLESILT